MKRNIRWNSIRYPGVETCVIEEGTAGVRITGSLTQRRGEVILQVEYELYYGADLVLRRAIGSMVQGSSKSRFSISVDKEQVWRLGKDDLPCVLGARDLDLGVSPAALSMTLRRMALEVGGTARTVAAWIRLPEIDVIGFPLEFTRLTRDTFRFRHSGSEFSEVLRVNDWGLILDYPGEWRAA